LSKISANREQRQACLGFAEVPPNLSNLRLFSLNRIFVVFVDISDIAELLPKMALWSWT
jgi:hypothetical protein